MKYITVRASDDLELDEAVNAHLSAGWKLQGGVCVARLGPGDATWTQAMTKAEPQDKE